MIVEGRDVIAVPMTYYDEFRRDPQDSLLKYGSLAQRARQPWFTNVDAIRAALVLPDQVTGERSELQHMIVSGERVEYRALVAAADERALLDGLSAQFAATDDSYWHVHVDLALNKKRHGDAAGIAMGRIAGQMIERSTDALSGPYERVVNHYEVPLAAQILAPVGDQIYIGSIVRLILQLKLLRGFNITSFSFDGFQSVEPIQQLTLAGLVTAGMVIDQRTGRPTGIPKAWSVDRYEQPYRELLEAVNERRAPMPAYAVLRRELRELETVGPHRAPDHPWNGSKDVADPCAGVVGYLATFGHTVLDVDERIFDRSDLERDMGLSLPDSLGVEDDIALDFGVEAGVGQGFGAE